LPVKVETDEAPKIEDSKTYISGNSLFFFSTENQFRKLCFKVANSKKLENLTICFVFISTCGMFVETPLNDPKETLFRTLFWIDVGVIIVFMSEALIKIIAHGFFFNGKSSYLRDGWNFLDFIILIF
jgi:hypothetical protein